MEREPKETTTFLYVSGQLMGALTPDAVEYVMEKYGHLGCITTEEKPGYYISIGRQYLEYYEAEKGPIISVKEVKEEGDE